MAGTVVLAFATTYAGALAEESLGERVRAAVTQLRATWRADGALEGAVEIAEEKLVELLLAVRAALPACGAGIAAAAAGDARGARRALVRALLLARLASPGETLVHRGCAAAARYCGPAQRSGVLRGKRIRGAVVDARRLGAHRPSAPALAEATYMGDEGVQALARPQAAPAPGTLAGAGLAVLRADPGRGGTRALRELLRRTPGALLLQPSGAGLEPLGSLRAAMARVFQQMQDSLSDAPAAGGEAKRAFSPALEEFEAALDDLLAGDGIALDVAARFLGAYLRDLGPVPVLLLDDAASIDPPSLSVCAELAKREGARIVARLDATEMRPLALSAIPLVAEYELAPFTRAEATQLAVSILGPLAPAPRTLGRIVRRGGTSPLGVVEAVTCWAAHGEISSAPDANLGDGALAARAYEERLSRVAASDVRLLRIVALAFGAMDRAVLEAVAAKLSFADVVGPRVQSLVDRGFLLTDGTTRVALPTRSHRDWLVAATSEAEQVELHGYIADVLEDDCRDLDAAEVGYHADRSGFAQRAAELLLLAATRAADLGYDASYLVASARAADPTTLAEARARVQSSIPVSLAMMGNIVVSPTSVRRGGNTARAATPAATFDPAEADTARRHPVLPDEEPADDATPTAMLPPKVAPASPVRPPSPPRRATNPYPAELSTANRPGDRPLLGDVAPELANYVRTSILSGAYDVAERWVDALDASGDASERATRLRGIVRSLRGDVPTGLRLLRGVREKASSPLRSCQGALALSFSLLHARRLREARIAALEALAIARELGHGPSERACLALFASLYRALGRTDVAADLRRQVLREAPAARTTLSV